MSSTPSQGDPRSWFERTLVASRLLIFVPVVVLMFSALGAFAYGTVLFVAAIQEVVYKPMPAGHKIGELLIIVDLFLIGATLLIASFGFYELFIGRIETRRGDRLPPWLRMRDLNDLKARVIAMIVLIAAVDFIQILVESSDGRQIMERGAGVALVIGALTAFVHFGGQGHDER